MDGKVNYLPKKFINGRTQVDADNLVPIVSAASIYAKVTRDKFMTQLAYKYPLYSFEKHVGYGTYQHQLALKNYGVIKSVHRFSYGPIAKALA
jgi:ribonuclease HII